MDDDLFISRHTLADRLGRPDAPLVIDVRREARFSCADHRVAAALRAVPPLPTSQDLVLYCVHGHEVSRTTALRLLTTGINTRFLLGGFEHWKAQGKPTQPKNTIA